MDKLGNVFVLLFINGVSSYLICKAQPKHGG